MEDGKGREERGALLQALEAELPRLLPDHEIVDRGLDLTRGPLRGLGSRRADFVAVDRSGRPVLVIVVDGRGDETVLEAINALAFARQTAEALARPGRAIIPSGALARVAVAADSFAPRALEGLSLLPERELLLFESRRIDTQAGSRLRFVSLALPAPLPVLSSADRDGFLAGMPEALRGTAELLLRRLGRVDAAIQPVFDGTGAVFRCEGRDLCALQVRKGGLQGAIPGLERSLPIRGMDDAEVFLDEVLREHLLFLGEGWSTPAAPSPAVPSERDPLLTAEEIAAFSE